MIHAPRCEEMMGSLTPQRQWQLNRRPEPSPLVARAEENTKKIRSILRPSIIIFFFGGGG
jgi:hypothetical protein